MILLMMLLILWPTAPAVLSHGYNSSFPQRPAALPGVWPRDCVPNMKGFPSSPPVMIKAHS